MPPTVRTLDELYSQSNSLYDPLRNNYRSQMSAAEQSLPELEKPLYAAKDRAFKDISQLASNKGMLFSGFAPDQQAKYVGEKFMPALTDLRSKVQDNIGRLQSALLGLDTEQRKGAMGLRENDLSKLYDYNKEQDRRKFDKEQSDIAYQRELQTLKTKAALGKESNEPTRYSWQKTSPTGGYEVYDGKGGKAPIDLATAVASQGGGINNLISLLMAGDPQDRKAAQQYLKDVQEDPVKAYANLVKNRGTAFYTGGGF